MVWIPRLNKKRRSKLNSSTHLFPDYRCNVTSCLMALMSCLPTMEDWALKL